MSPLNNPSSVRGVPARSGASSALGNHFADPLISDRLIIGGRRGERIWLVVAVQVLPESDCDTKVVVVDDVPIGHVTVSGHRLVHLFVEPDHQGMGLGRYLLELGEAMIVAGGHMDFELHARVENLPAIAFYERAGWTVTDRMIHTVEHGISYDERVLVKQRQ